MIGRATLRRAGLIAAGLTVAAGILAPFQKANHFRGKIQSSLESALGRKVEVGEVRYNLFTGPGFTVQDVTISEDDRFGVEPFVYVASLDARIRILGLLGGRLEFSNLRLQDPSVNLVKSDSGAWNFQAFIEKTAAVLGKPATLPAIQVRSGRINFKFGDRKSVFYFSDADFDVSPDGPQKISLRFAGDPTRTDRVNQSFGRLRVRGVWTPPTTSESRVDLSIELDRTSITEVVRLVEGTDLGLHGTLESEAKISGPVSDIRISGSMRLGDIHRWDLLASRSGTLDLKYRGSVNAHLQRLDLETAPAEGVTSPVVVKFRAADYLSVPRWGTTLELRGLPAATLLEVARHMGVTIPPKVSIDGKLSGAIGYAVESGFQGQLSLDDAAVTLPDGPPVRLAHASTVIGDGQVTIEPATVRLENEQTAEVAGQYHLDGSGLDVRVATRGLDVAQMQAGTGRFLGAAGVPLLEICRQGVWRGALRYHRTGEESAWAGQVELQGVNVELPGVAEALKIQSASVALDGSRVAVTKVRGRLGKLAVESDYRFDEANTRPHRLRLAIAEADLTEIERLLLPTLQRAPQGFLARTLRLARPGPVPAWLKERKLDGTLRIDRLMVDGTAWKINSARILWDGAQARLLSVDGGSGDAKLGGRMEVDLTGLAPRYTLTGQVRDLPYKDGTLSLEGKWDAAGTGKTWRASLKGEGSFDGADIAFNPETEFLSISGCFELAAGSNGLLLKLTAVQALQGFETLIGQGSTQPDGQLLLELSSGAKQTRFAGALFPPKP